MSIECFTNIDNGFGVNESNHLETQNRRFRSLFGCSPLHCFQLWSLIEDHPPGSEPKNLLYALLLLKVYSSEHVHRAIIGNKSVCGKAFRKWSCTYIKLLSELNVES